MRKFASIFQSFSTMTKTSNTHKNTQ